MFEITTTTTITAQQVCDLICTGLEGGYSPWLHKFQLKSEFSNPSKLVWYGHAEFWANEYAILARFDGPDDEEGSGRTIKVIKPADVRHAFKLMADNHPTDFGDFLRQEDDASTGDTFLQLLCLGEVIYG